MVYEDIIQLEQALIELDEQNTLNALEIKKREAKVFLLEKQIEDIEETRHGSKENVQANADGTQGNDVSFIRRHIGQHQEQIQILSESTKQNLLKRHSMKNQLYEDYQQIKQIR